MTALSAMTRNEARLLAREPALLAWGVAIPLVATVALNVIPAMRGPQPVLGGLSWGQAYVPTIVLFTLALVAVQMLPQMLGTYRQDGILRRLRTTPVSPAILLTAVCLVLCGVGLLVAALIILTPVLTGVGLPGSAAWLILSTLFALLSFVAIGALITAVAPNARFATGIGACVTPVLWFASGMWIPLAVMPQWLARICEVVPSGAAGRAMQAAMLGGTPTLGQYAVMAAWTIACSLLAARWFRWE